MTLQIVGSGKIIRAVTVWCGVESGNRPQYRKEAHDLGQIFAGNGTEGVFGGADCGTMGAFATGLIAHGGKVKAVMPEWLRDVQHPPKGCRVEWVTNLEERMRQFIDREKVDAVVTLPGGIGSDHEYGHAGTLDKHNKLGIPSILVNILGFYDYKILDLRHRAEEGFLWREPAERMYVANSVTEVLPMIRAHYAGEPVQNIFTTPLQLDSHRVHTM